MLDVAATAPEERGRSVFLESEVQALVRASRLAQGLPERITDPSVLARLATLVSTNRLDGRR